MLATAVIVSVIVKLWKVLIVTHLLTDVFGHLDGTKALINDYSRQLE